MGYSHGRKWTEKEIEKEIFKIIEFAGIDGYMPSSSQIQKTTSSFALSCAIERNGGFKHWAEKLGLKVKDSESKFGRKYEEICFAYLTDELKFDCEYTNTKYPYDIIANSVKIDVKSSNLYDCGHGRFYTFNLEKEKPTCDVFVCYCVKENIIKKVYVIPACIMQGKTQLSIGENKSKYDNFIDNWDVVKGFNSFYENIKKAYRD